MKFLLPVALLAAAGVSAQDSSCKANYIVDRCLSSEKPKALACDVTDYDCQCAAYEAIATCYNNCPADPRASSAKQQVSSSCRSASLYGNKNGTASASATTMSPSSTLPDGRPANTASFAVDAPAETGAADALARGSGGLLLAVAAAVGAAL